jgi:hypothetical protein
MRLVCTERAGEAIVQRPREGLISWRPALLKWHQRCDAHSIQEFCQKLFGVVVEAAEGFRV